MMADCFYRHKDGRIVCTYGACAHLFPPDQSILCLFLRDDGEWVFGYAKGSSLTPLPREDQVRLKMFGQ